MTVNGSAEYATTAAFRRAVDDRLKAHARVTGRNLQELRREFLFQRFLALLFSAPLGQQWVLKGGASLLMRLADARSSKDLDLLRLGEIDPDQAVAELREITRARDGDQLTFVVEDGVTYSSNNPVVEISVTAYVGGLYERFPIDLATELHLVAAPERVTPVPVVHVPGLPAPPELVLYPLTDQVADKVCAMFERYGNADAVSTRFRDLLDLALIVTTSELDGRNLALAVVSETRRRGVVLPTAMKAPGPNWPAGYAATARGSRIAPHLRQIDYALAAVAACMDSVLSGDRSHGVWNPAAGRWD